MSLEEITLRSAEGGYQRSAWFRPGPGTAHRLGICLDGEYYLDRADALSEIEAMTERNVIPSMSWLFLASGGPEARHADFTYSPTFTRFVANEVVDWARSQVASIVNGDHLVCGLSLSGLAAAHLALVHRDRFSAALCQSGSFWWKPDQLAAVATSYPPPKTRFWLSVGDEETAVGVSHPPTGMYQATSQIDGVKQARSVLEQAGGDVHYHRYQGGHDFAPWRAELPEALGWLLRT
jgi:enterochelin esterase family protein